MRKSKKNAGNEGETAISNKVLRKNLCGVHMPITTGLWRLRQEDHYKFKASLHYRVSSGLAWAT